MAFRVAVFLVRKAKQKVDSGIEFKYLYSDHLIPATGSMVRHDLLPGRYEAVTYSSRGKFNVELTLRDHSPYHAGVVNNTYYVECISFEVESEKITVIQGYMRLYRTKDLHEKDREDSGGYTAYWEPRVQTIRKRAISMQESR